MRKKQFFYILVSRIRKLGDNAFHLIRSYLSSAHNARRAASCSAFLQLVPVAVNCCPEGRETCTVKCRACSGPSQARVV